MMRFYWLLILIAALAFIGFVAVIFAHTIVALKTRWFAKEGTQGNEERFRTIIDTIQDYAIFTLDTDGFVTSWNSGAAKMSGYDSGEILGKHFSIMFPKNGNEGALCNKELQTARTLGIFQDECLRIRKDGSTFWSSVVIRPIYNSTKLTGFVKVAKDISERKVLERQMQKLNEDLERRVELRTSELRQREAQLVQAKEAAETANIAKSAFLANMSHEIRTPLGLILGFSELVTRADTTPSEKLNFIDAIKRNGTLLSNIIDDILDLSKVEAGRMEMQKRNVRFEEILRDLNSLLSLEAVEKGLALKVTTSAGVPRIICTDPLRLRQILFNIVGNAVKFTSHGSIRVKAEVQKIEGKTKLAFIVKDTGKGISPEQATHLFEHFSQGDASSTRVFGGSGIGLILSRKLARALGGDVALTESTLGIGSTFVITIDPGDPECEVDEPGTKIEISASPPEFPLLASLKVLLVDDSPDNQILVGRLLRRSGAVVTTASNGRECVEKAHNSAFDLILMDLQMPEMDGYEATRVLRREGFQKPIIALTAHAMQEERRRCLENGFSDHISKPVDRDLLLRTLAQHSSHASN